MNTPVSNRIPMSGIIMSLAPAAAGVLIVINAVPDDVLPFFNEKDDPVPVLVK
jgi:hypothetical protein